MELKPINRRNFLKFGLISLTSMAFRPRFGRKDTRQPATVGRVTIKEIEVYSRPDSESPIIGKRFMDQLVTIYYSITAEKGPAYNPIWHRVWGGYVHSAYLQLVETHFNRYLQSVPESGQLCEVTVPYTEAHIYNRWDGWKSLYHLYYETTHWVTDIIEGPDNQPWYQITSELDKYLSYYVPALHLRPIPDDEISPLSPDVPAGNKRIEVNLGRQLLTAFEGNTNVYQARISSGIPSAEPIPEGTGTTRGKFNISSKSPSKHMGALRASGAPGEYSLPGVPWTSFFIYEYGVAFHGTFWHNNFGIPMSHGCVNMKNQDAKWLFRWTTPQWEVPVIDRSAWDRRGFGTLVEVI